MRPMEKPTVFHLILVNFTETPVHRARGREGRHAVRTRCEWPASNSGVQRRLRLQKCKAFGVSFLFAPAGIFVHVCRRCQRADRAGGIHVGLIFCQLFYQEKSWRIIFSGVNCQDAIAFPLPSNYQWELYTNDGTVSPFAAAHACSVAHIPRAAMMDSSTTFPTKLQPLRGTVCPANRLTL